VGVLVVDKTPGPTSFEVVKRVRRALAGAWGVSERRLKVGHGGTLDPLASGVLPVCVGEATKLAPFLLDADKEYHATARLGIETETLDADGAVVATHPVAGLTAAAVEEALVRFRGEIEQTPPMYSALKRDGRRLYDYARAGETVVRASRRVVVHELAMLGFDPPDVVHLQVRCSKGTYVRVLAADLGAALGVGAHLTALRRVASGPFHLGQALTLEVVVERIARGEPLPFVSLTAALSHLPQVVVGPAMADAVREGRRLAWTALGAGAPPGGQVRLVRESGALVAVVEPGEDGALRSLRVFARAAADEVPGLPEAWGD
jgi:tRNA pseudouridine55 synthase